MRKPMRGCDVDLDKVVYPVLGSFKYDGIRSTNQLGYAISRSGIPLPSLQVQRLFGHPALSHFDGELISGEPNKQDTYSTSYSAVMTAESEAPVTYYVFDLIEQGDMQFIDRYEQLRERVQIAQRVLGAERVVFVEQRWLHSKEEVLAFEAEALELGYEGIMLRNPYKPYKYGKSSMVGQHLMKLKQFADSEAEIEGWEEQMSNENELQQDAFGNAKRSSHKANKTPNGLLGKWHVRDIHTGVRFKLGTARVTNDVRKEWWDNRENYRGRICVYRHQLVGAKDKPRIASFKWWRDRMDFDVGDET